MKPAHLDLLLDLLHQPTAPFREGRVIEFATAWLRRQRVPFFVDPCGNVVAGCASREAYRRLLRRRSPEPVRLFIAHLDHPGFHGVRWIARDRLAVRWHGGAPTKHLTGADVWLSDGERMLEGRLRAVRLLRNRRSIATAQVHVRDVDAAARPRADALYGGFKFRAPVWRAGRRLYTKAADDLVGAFAVLLTAQRACATGAPFLGLLTRAEEVGFIGAIGHLQLGWLDDARRPVVAVSLETSRTLPGALVGRGPVVRLGDRRTVFDAGALNVLRQIAERRLPGRHQRRIMDGGSCEATAATAFGIPAIGISVPLGNYHNQGYEGGPDCRGPGGPAPEFVHLDDVEGLLALCLGLLQPRLPWTDPWKRERDALTQSRRRYDALMRSGLAKQRNRIDRRGGTEASPRK